MKNHPQLKRSIGISTLTLLISVGPMYASSQQAAQPSDPPLIQAAMSRDSSAGIEKSGREIDEPAGADNEKNWSWLGLLGLLGLLGMKRGSGVRDENYRPLRT